MLSFSLTAERKEMNITASTSTPLLPSSRTTLKSHQQQHHHHNHQHLHLAANKPDSAVLLLQICNKFEELVQLQTLLIKTSLIKEKHAFGRLLLSFSSLDKPETALNHARKLCDAIEFRRNSFIYNTMMKAYLKCGKSKEAFFIYVQMVCDNDRDDGFVFPDDFTFTFVFNACLKFSGCFEGKQAHGQMIKSPVRYGTCSYNSLMSFYVQIGETGFVIEQIFDRIEEPDTVSWNCLLDGYVKSGELVKAQNVFDKMPRRDIVSYTTLLVGYVNSGLMDQAYHIFNEMPERNTVTWSALIGGYVKVGSYGKAMDLFKRMQSAKIMMDKVTMTILLSACSSLGALDQGRWIHAYIEYHSIKVDARLLTALIDMYSKCGEINIARQLFESADNKKVYTWNAMLGGLAMHSLGQTAVQLFTKMIKCKIKPNEITFLCVLAGCNHSGLVNDGLRIFHSMVNNRNLKPSIEHYACIVDLLARSGFINEAFEMIGRMPMRPDSSVWRTMISACKLHRNVEMGEKVGRILIEMEPPNEVNYVLLSNIYAVDCKWEEVGKLRKEMKARGLVKTPGCSSIELNGVVHEFVARDKRHPMTKDIYAELQQMMNHMAPHGLDTLSLRSKDHTL